MADWRQETHDDYKRKGFAVSCGYGTNPALLVVDFINGFTDPTTPLGGDFSKEIASTQELLTVFSRCRPARHFHNDCLREPLPRRRNVDQEGPVAGNTAKGNPHG